jgi:hypothetical protein
MTLLRTKYHLGLGQHIYADAPRDTVVDQIIALYTNKGLEGLYNTRWPADKFTTPKTHIINDNGYQLGRWCLDNGAHDLLKAVHSIFTPHAHKELITHALHENDDAGLDLLIEMRADGWKDAVAIVFGPKFNQLWLSKVLNRGVDNATWQNGFEALAHQRMWGNNTELSEALLGGWCTRCQSLVCCAPDHKQRVFLNSTTQSKTLACLLHSFVPSLSGRKNFDNTLAVLEQVRLHSSWDNTNKETETVLLPILQSAVQQNNKELVALLLGPNDRVLGLREEKQRLCVNSTYIAHAFSSIPHHSTSELAPLFMGLMDDKALEGKPQLVKALEENRRQREYVNLLSATHKHGEIRLKRKM